MLVLTRKTGEEIVIGDDVRIRIAEIHNGRVRIGITAPLSIPIDRAEVRDKRMKRTLSAGSEPVRSGIESAALLGDEEEDSGAD